MFKVILARLLQGHRTMRYPDGAPPPLPERFRGRLVFDVDRCPEECARCAEVCPTQAIQLDPRPRVDLGRCLFCADCADACPNRAVRYALDHRMAVRQRGDLVVGPQRELRLAEAMSAELRKLFGRSLKLRQVSAGGCNACEADVNVLNTIGWDLGRFGIQIVASPRHADGLLITGPVSCNMHLALRKTYDAVPDPKIVIAVGACAIAGGPYIGHTEVADGADSVVPVDLYVPGCPPHPLTILDGLLRLLGRLRPAADIPAAPAAGARQQPELSPLHRAISRIDQMCQPARRWYQRFRQTLAEYERRNVAEWQYWGTRRAKRESGMAELPSQEHPDAGPSMHSEARPIRPPGRTNPKKRN